MVNNRGWHDPNISGLAVTVVTENFENSFPSRHTLSFPAPHSDFSKPDAVETRPLLSGVWPGDWLDGALLSSTI
jgi:hypothetical protein